MVPRLGRIGQGQCDSADVRVISHERSTSTPPQRRRILCLGRADLVAWAGHGSSANRV